MQAVKRAKTTVASKKQTSKKSQKVLPKKPNNAFQLTTVNLGLGLPKRVSITHKFVENGTISSTLGVFNSVLYSCNGMFQPRSGSIQPFYFDQLSALYNHYTVIGSRCKVTIIPTATNNSPSAVAIMLNDDTSATALTNIADVSGQTQASQTKYIATGSNIPTQLMLSWSAKGTFGGSVLGNDNLQGNVAANPTEQTYFQIVYQTLNTTTDQVYVNVEIEYIAVWDELKEIAKS